MITKIHLPSPALRPFFRIFMALEGELKFDTPQHTIPKGEPALIFPFNKPNNFPRFNENTQIFSDLLALDKPLLMGQSTTFGFFNWYGAVHLIIVPVFPHLLPFIIKDKASTINNSVVSLEYLGLKFKDNYLKERLWEAQTAEEAVDLVEVFLVNCLIPLMDRTLPTCIEPVTKWIQRQKGMVKIRDVAAKFKVSTRRLEQQFLDQIGISPVKYARIIKFRALVQAMLAKPNLDFYQLEEDFEYYDQSHLIRDFKQFAGVSPTIFTEEKPLFDKISLAHAF